MEVLAVEESFDYMRLILFLGWGICAAIVFMHASYNDKNVLTSAALGVIPVFGIIIYFLVHYISGMGDAARRAQRKKERQWEFVLTDKGKKKDPNAPEEEEQPNNSSAYPGHMPEIIDESPLSREPDD